MDSPKSIPRPSFTVESEFRNPHYPPDHSHARYRPKSTQDTPRLACFPLANGGVLRYYCVLCCPIVLQRTRPYSAVERCWSGRTGLPAKQLHWQNRCRGFESPPLRHDLCFQLVDGPHCHWWYRNGRFRAPMNRHVNLTKRVRTPNGSRFCPVVVSANGRVRPYYVIVSYREEQYPEGASCLE